MTIEQAIKETIDLAASQIGYEEPNHDNYNKYAHDFDTKWWGWFNGKKDGNDWCSIFTQWVFVERFGEKVADKMLNHSSQYGTRSAVVQYLYRSLMEVNRVGKEPHVGDIIFYHNNLYSGLAQLCHVGIVWKINGDYVTTIEGNSGNSNTKVATRCIKKDYDTKSWGIYGYGYPDYSAASSEPTPDPKSLDGYTVGNTYKVICKDTLNVRTKAEVSDSSTIITALNPGTSFVCKALTRDGYDNTWMRIDSPASGWIAAKYNGEKYIGEGDSPKTVDGYTVGKNYTVIAKKGVNVRSGAGTDYSIVKAISYGTDVTCYDIKISNGNTWIRISENNQYWAAAHYEGDRYIS